MEGDRSIALPKNKKQKLDVDKITYINLLDISNLELLACVKIAYELWKTEIFQVLQDKECNSFHSLSPKILDNVKLLPLPPIIKQKVAKVVTPVGHRLYSWVEKNYDVSFLCSFKNIDFICWTPNNEINEKKTLESLVRILKPDELIKPSVLVAACNLCSEDSVFFILKKMQERNVADKLEFSSRVLSFLVEERDSRMTYLLYWMNYAINTNSTLIYNLNDNELVDFFDNSLHRISNLNYKYMAEFSISLDNLYALKFFWLQLSDEEKIGILRKWLDGDKILSYDPVLKCEHVYSRTFLFLFSHLSGSQRRELSNAQSQCILYYFRETCDWQHFRCIETIINMLDDDLNFEIFRSIVLFKRDSSIAKSFLQCCSIRLRRHIFSHFYDDDEMYMFLVLLEIGDAELLKIIISIVDLKERKKFLLDFFQRERYTLYTLYSIQSLDFKMLEKLNILIEGTDMNSDEITNFKRIVFENYVMGNIKHWVSEWKILDTFLEWAFSTPNEIVNFKKSNFAKYQIVRCFMDQYCEYENVDEFLFWVFSGAGDEISLFKRECAFNIDNLLLCGCIGKTFEGFTKFLNWSMSSTEDIDNFKAFIGSNNHLIAIISDIFRYDTRTLNFCEGILKWCIDSKERILQLKREFLMSDRGHNIINLWIRKYSELYEEDRMILREVAGFFCSVGKETVSNFKESFIRYYTTTFLYTWKALDENVDMLFQWLDKFNDIQSEDMSSV